MIPLRDDNPSSITPVVSWVLIGACVLAFLWQFSLGPREGQVAVYALGVIPAVLFEGARLPPEIEMVSPTASVFTSMFLHGGWMHLIGNMLYLWIFGDNVEDSMGHGRFVVFYLLCGVAAVLAQSLPDTHSQIPMIGASGAISGVLGAYVLLHPHARVLVLIPLGFFTQIIYLRAGIVLGLWFALQLFSSLATPPGSAGGGVRCAHWRLRRRTCAHPAVQAAQRAAAPPGTPPAITPARFRTGIPRPSSSRFGWTRARGQSRRGPLLVTARPSAGFPSADRPSRCSGDAKHRQFRRLG